MELSGVPQSRASLIGTPERDTERAMSQENVESQFDPVAGYSGGN
jgi:hypothetical protein